MMLIIFIVVWSLASFLISKKTKSKTSIFAGGFLAAAILFVLFAGIWQKQYLTLIVMVILMVLCVSIMKSVSATDNKKAKTQINKPDKQVNKEPDKREWLEQKWTLAEKHKADGDKSFFPYWYWDEITDSQKRRLEKDGIKDIDGLTKGMASDLIGLNEKPSEGTLEIFKFFKMPIGKNMNQTKANHEINILFEDPEKVKAWNERPATSIQKEFYRFFGLPIEKNLTAVQADKTTSDYISELAEKEDPQLDEWESLKEILEELSDSEICRDYNIKKPSFTLIKTALENLIKEGRSYQDVRNGIDSVIDEIIKLKPDIHRE